MKQFSLTQLLAKMDWAQIQATTGAHHSSTDEIHIAFCRDKKKDPLAPVDRVRIKIGAQILQELGWKKGDRIYIFNDPDDVMLFRLIKSKSRDGWKLQTIPSSPNMQLSFKWTNKLALTEQKFTAYKHTVFMENIFFRVGEAAEFVV